MPRLPALNDGTLVTTGSIGTIQNILLLLSSHTVVYLSFEGESISMDENSGMVNVCLFLSEVIELTQSDIWANVVSVQDTAMSTC